MDNLQLVKDVMKLVTDNQPKETILAEANKVRLKFTASIAELQQANKLLDSIVETFVIGDDRPHVLGKITEAPPTKSLYFPTNEHVLELAGKFKVNGTVDTSKVVKQLQSEGDSRSERGIAISVGNILNHNGWSNIFIGLYKEPAQEEVK